MRGTDLPRNIMYLNGRPMAGVLSPGAERFRDDLTGHEVHEEPRLGDKERTEARNDPSCTGGATHPSGEWTRTHCALCRVDERPAACDASELHQLPPIEILPLDITFAGTIHFFQSSERSGVRCWRISPPTSAGSCHPREI